MSDVITPFQPVLPAEGPFTDAELAFIDDSPQGLFPENQDSNYGFFRKVWTDYIQNLIEIQNELYAERFVESSTIYLDEWERQVGLPMNPAGKTIAQRRNEISLRLQRGPFTRSRRQDTVERFIAATFGAPVELTSGGVALTTGGVPLYAESEILNDSYHIIEDIDSFSYDVRILDTLSPDLVGLNRELKRITPAGIEFTITSHTWPFHNYVVNPSAEVNTSGWNWWVSTGTATFTRVVEGTAPAGAHVFQLAGSGTQTLYIYNDPIVRVRPGQRVWFMGYARGVAGNIQNLQLLSRWQDARGGSFSEQLVTNFISAPVMNTWYPFEGVVVAPPNAKLVGMGVAANAVGASTIQADRFMIYPLAEGESVPTLASDYIET